jgi:hypothetical protein
MHSVRRSGWRWILKQTSWRPREHRNAALGRTFKSLRRVIKDTVGFELPPAARKAIDLEDRIVKGGVRKALRDRQLGLTELVHVIQEYRMISESKPLTLRGSDYAHAVQELHKAIDRAEGLLSTSNQRMARRPRARSSDE